MLSGSVRLIAETGGWGVGGGEGAEGAEGRGDGAGRREGEGGKGELCRGSNYRACFYRLLYSSVVRSSEMILSNKCSGRLSL